MQLTTSKPADSPLEVSAQSRAYAAWHEQRSSRRLIFFSLDGDMRLSIAIGDFEHPVGRLILRSSWLPRNLSVSLRCCHMRDGARYKRCGATDDVLAHRGRSRLPRFLLSRLRTLIASFIFMFVVHCVSLFKLTSRTSNQSVELTATRRAFTFQMTRTSSLRARSLSVAVAHFFLVRCMSTARSVLLFVATLVLSSCDVDLFGLDTKQIAAGYRLTQAEGGHALMAPHENSGPVVIDVGWRNPFIIARSDERKPWKVIDTSTNQKLSISEEQRRTDPRFEISRSTEQT